MSKTSYRIGIVLVGAAALALFASASASAVCTNLALDFTVPAPTGSAVFPLDVDEDGFNDAFVFHIVVNNAGAFNRTANLTFALVSPSGLVTYRAEAGTFSVPANGSQAVDAQLVLTETDESGSWLASIDLTEVIAPLPPPCDSRAWNPYLYPLGRHDPQVLSLNTSKEVEQNSNADYSLMMTNGGNLQDTLVLNAFSPGGWYAENGTGSFPLNAGETLWIIVSMHAPLNAAPQATDITTLSLSSTRSPSSVVYITLTTTVAAQVFAPGISADPISGYGIPGSTVSFNVTVTNNGNNRDAISLRGSVSTDGWSLNFPPPFAVLNAGESVVVQISVNVPLPVSSLISWDPDVEAVSQDDMTSAGVTLSVLSVYTDFSVGPSDIELPGATVNEGDEIVIAVTVHNNGHTAAGAVSVSVDVGSVFPYQTVITEIAGSGGTVIVEVPWVSTAGVFLVTVTVDDVNGFVEIQEDDNTASLELRVNSRPVAAVEGPTTATAGVPVEFSALESIDLDGEVVSFFFDFGDGTNSGWVGTSAVTHAYGAGGDFTVTVHVMDDMDVESQNSASLTVLVNGLPTASLVANPAATLGTPVVLSADESSDDDGEVVSFFFDFGDGTNSGWVATPSVMHNYTAAGDYTVSVRVQDNIDAESNNTASVRIHVNAPPSAAAVAPSAATTGLSVVISANGSADADGAVASYYFDFGDGTNSGWVATSSVTHTYAAAGNYTVAVRVRDALGAESGDATTVVVASAPAPPPAAGGFLPGFGAELAAVAVLGVALALIAGRRRRLQ